MNAFDRLNSSQYDVIGIQEMWRKTLSVGFFVLAVSVSTATVFPSVVGQQPKRELTASSKSEPDPSAGQELFTQVCGGCHGPRGGGGRAPGFLEGRQVQQMRRPSEQELFNIIQKGIPGTEMPPFPLPDQQIWQLVAFVRSLNAPAIETEVAGNQQAGREIFFGKGNCTNCHMIRGQGGFLGPDLSNVGLRRTLSRLREALLEPDTEVAAGYQGVTVTKAKGQKITGISKNNDNYSIQILDAQGELHLLLKKGLEEVVWHEKSMMPDDYARRLTAVEIEDLLSFLSRQSIRSVSAK